MLRRSPGQEDGLHPVSSQWPQAEEGMHKAAPDREFRSPPLLVPHPEVTLSSVAPSAVMAGLLPAVPIR
jgi:hypothetical protein